MFKEGERVCCPSADGTGEVEATFLAAADPDEAVTVELAGKHLRRDAAWVRYEDGTTARWPYHRIKRVAT